MIVSTDIAEVILERVAKLAFEQLLTTNHFNMPVKDFADLPFGIIAYGKFAGYELAYAQI